MGSCATFNGISLGDHNWLEIETENEVEIHKIPRADGAILRRRGGGLKTFTVHGWIVKTQRSDIEQFFDGLAANTTSAVASLVINGNTYTNCILKSISPDGDHNRWSRFTIVLFKSG